MPAAKSRSGQTTSDLGDAAVGEEFCAGDEAGIVRGKEECCGSDFIRMADEMIGMFSSKSVAMRVATLVWPGRTSE